MTEDLTRGVAEENGSGTEISENASFIEGAGGAETLTGQAGVVVERPAAGETLQIAAEAGESYVLNFDPSEAQAIVEGDNLILLFPDGSKIVFVDLVVLVQQEDGPSLQYAGEDLIATLAAQGVIPGVLDIFTLTEPDPGEILTITAALGQRFIINFDPSAAQIQVVDGNLVLVFANGGRIVIEGLGNLVDQENAPTFEIAGTEIPGGTLFAQAVALTEGEAGPAAAATLETAAGGALNDGGVTEYNDDAGDTIDLLDPQGVIPPVFLEFDTFELEVVENFPDEDVPDTPPEADPVLTPAETSGAIPSGLALLLNLGSPGHIPFAFKEITVTGEIGDDDNFFNPFGGGRV
ncbi:MAG: hypothetical protein V3T80_10300, partial [Kiloniellales bacterium]